MNQQDKEAKAIEKLYDNILKAHKLPEIIDIDRLRGNFYGLCKSSTYGLVNGDSNEMRKMLFDYFLPHLRQTKTDALKAKDKEIEELKQRVISWNEMHNNLIMCNMQKDSDAVELITKRELELLKALKKMYQYSSLDSRYEAGKLLNDVANCKFQQP